MGSCLSKIVEYHYKVFCDKFGKNNHLSSTIEVVAIQQKQVFSLQSY